MEGTAAVPVGTLQSGPGPSEKTNLADDNPQRVAALQGRIEVLAREGVQPLFPVDALGAAKHVLFGSVATPDEERDLERQP